jgi:hypothetical protein
MTDNNNYNAVDLLNKILEFEVMTPSKGEWSLEALKSNPPRQIRLRQIISLINAFLTTLPNINYIAKEISLPLNNPKLLIESFLAGDFIQQKRIEDYASTIKFMKDFVKKTYFHYRESSIVDLLDLAFIFPELVDYKRRLQKILTFNEGWIEANSTAAQFSIQITSSISRHLESGCSDLDKALELLINPKGLYFTRGELINRFNFPSENLSEIDLDFM